MEIEWNFAHLPLKMATVNNGMVFACYVLQRSENLIAPFPANRPPLLSDQEQMLREIQGGTCGGMLAWCRVFHAASCF